MANPEKIWIQPPITISAGAIKKRAKLALQVKISKKPVFMPSARLKKQAFELHSGTKHVAFAFLRKRLFTRKKVLLLALIIHSCELLNKML